MPAKPTDDMSKHSMESPQHGQKHNLRNRFEVLKTLGQGTYGKVKLAIDKLSGTEVAIKYIKKTKIESENDLVRIRREIDIMSKLSHPHIIKVYDVFENKEKIILVMEYASGGELYDYINEKQGLDEDEARRYFRQIVSAVHYLHQNGIVHRDLKLENIVLDHLGDIKIADFGLSNLYSKDSMLHTFCGSPLYASPEIINGLPYSGPEVDCWSLGVLLYAIVYGAMPFDGSDFRKLRNQITAGQYFEPENPSESASLIKSILTTHSGKRAGIKDICRHWWVNVGFQHTPEDVSTLSWQTEDQSQEDSMDVGVSVPQTDSHSDHQPVVMSSSLPKKGILKHTTAEKATKLLDSVENESTFPSQPHHQPAPLHTNPSSDDLDQDSLEENDVNEDQQNNDHDRPSPRPDQHSDDVTVRVPENVFDSSKKPTRGILKNKNKQKYKGSDSGCVIVNAPEDSELYQSDEQLNNLHRDAVLEYSYDLADIESALDDLDNENAAGNSAKDTVHNHPLSLDELVQCSHYISSDNKGAVIQNDCGLNFYNNSTVVKRRKGILKKHGKFSADNDPTKRYSYGSQGSNSSGDILDFSYDSLDEDIQHYSSSFSMSGQEEISKFASETTREFHTSSTAFSSYDNSDVDKGEQLSYKNDDEEVARKIEALDVEHINSKHVNTMKDSDLFDLQEARLVYKQALRYCEDNAS